jgi:ribosomal protein S18 acetylase RimI-like enzyme
MIVDESVRGKGIGKALVLYLLEIAKARGAKSVALTSNPGRISANRLYQSLGFKRRETNAYFFIF